MRAPEKRSAFETQLAELAFRQIETEGGTLASKVAARIKGEERKRWEALREQLKEFDGIKPDPLPQAFIVTDVGSKAPPTFIPGRENGEVIEPGIPAVIESSWSFGKQAFAKNRARALAGRSEKPANFARDGEPHLAASFRARNRGHGQRLRTSWRTTHSPGTTRLAGSRIYEPRLEHEVDASAHRDLSHVSAVFSSKVPRGRDERS